MKLLKRLLREWLLSDSGTSGAPIRMSTGGINAPTQFIVAVYKATNGHILEYRIFNPNGADYVTNTILPEGGNLTEAITTLLVQGALSK